MLLKKIQASLIANQAKYGYNKGNKVYYKSMKKSWLEKNIQHIMKENLLLLKDSQGP